MKTVFAIFGVSLVASGGIIWRLVTRVNRLRAEVDRLRDEVARLSEVCDKDTLSIVDKATEVTLKLLHGQRESVRQRVLMTVITHLTMHKHDLDQRRRQDASLPGCDQ